MEWVFGRKRLFVRDELDGSAQEVAAPQVLDMAKQHSMEVVQALETIFDFAEM